MVTLNRPNYTFAPNRGGTVTVSQPRVEFYLSRGYTLAE